MITNPTRKTQIKFLGYFIITNLLVAGIIGSLLYWYSSEAIKQETISSEQSIFLEMNRSTELLMNQVELFMSQIATNQDIVRMIEYNNNADYEKLMAINNDLSWKKILMSFIYNITIYYHNEEIVYEVNTGFYELEDYPYKNLLESVVIQPTFPSQLPLSTISSINSNERLVNVVSIVKPIPMDGSDPQAYVVINIEEGYFRNIIDSYINKEGMEIYFMNHHGDIIASNNSNRKYTEIVDGFSPLALDLSKTGYQTDKFKGDRVLISAVSSDDYGWRFVSVIPYGNIVGKVQFIKSYSLAVILLAIGLGLVLSLRFSNKISAPLDHIAEMLNKSGTKQNSSKDVFKFIEGNIQSLVERNTQFNQHLAEHMPVLRNNFMTHILMGNLPEADQLEAKLDYYGIHYNAGAPYIVCIIPLANFRKQTGQRSEQEMSMLAVYLIEVLNEFLSNGREGLVLNTKPDEVAIILEIPGDWEQQENAPILELALSIQNVVNGNIGYKPAIGIGEPCNNLQKLSESYAQAEKALHYQLLVGDSGILFYSDIKKSQGSNFNYPLKLEKRLLEALSTGEESIVLSLNREMFVSFMVQEDYSEVFYYYMHLLNSTVKYVFEAGLKLEDIVIGGNLYQEILQCSDISEVSMWFEHLFIKICHKVKARTNGKSYDLVQTLEQYIQENIATDLSVAALSAQVYLSPAYMRKLFKEGTGKSIKAYISEIRFEQAKKLLINTMLPIAEVGEKIGYDKVHAFIYFFKENSGMSPGEYRLKSKRKEEENS